MFIQYAVVHKHIGLRINAFGYEAEQQTAISAIRKQKKQIQVKHHPGAGLLAAPAFPNRNSTLSRDCAWYLLRRLAGSAR